MSIIYVNETETPNASKIKVVIKRNDCGLPMTSDNIILMVNDELPVPCFVKVEPVDIVNVMESVYIADKCTIIASTASEDFLENIIIESNMTLFPYAISEDFSETDHDSVTVVSYEGTKSVAMELQGNIYIMDIRSSMNLNHNTKELLMNYDRELGTVVRNMLTMGPTEFMMMQPMVSKDVLKSTLVLGYTRYHIASNYAVCESSSGTNNTDDIGYEIHYFIFVDGKRYEVSLYDHGIMNRYGEDISLGYVMNAVLMILDVYCQKES